MSSEHAVSDKQRNIDPATVEGFGDEWARFDQSQLSDAECEEMFDAYFRIFPWTNLPALSEGFDLGSGSGRWARRVAPRVGLLHCVDASGKALDVCRRQLSSSDNVVFHEASVDAIPLPDASQDFGYSLGVLHHIPDTAGALKSCVEKLKPGAPFLLYLYYAFDQRSRWFRALWRVSDVLRRGVSIQPDWLRSALSDLLALFVYWPLARSARLLELLGLRVGGVPLSYYRTLSFYTMRTDARDRFGTRLEQRFTRLQIESMMRDAGLEEIRFSESAPFWCAVGIRAE